MTTLIKFIIGFLTAILVTSCNFDLNIGQMQGNGNVITEDLNITEDFSEISAGDGWEVFLEKGNSNSVVLEADENLIEAADIYVKDGKLKIYCDKGIGNATSKKVYVTYSENLTEVSVNSGASLTTKEALTGDEIDLDASSGGTLRVEVTVNDVETNVSSGGIVRISGTANRVDASVSSGGVARISKLKSVSAIADASSGGVMDVYASQDLRADASSGGVINYYGKPANVDKPKESYSGGIIRSKD